MNDQFLHELRREPRPAFARDLRAALDDGAERETERSLALRLRRWVPAAASLAIVSVVFTLPSVRAGAQAFLDLFRVANVVGVSFNASQLRNLADGELDLTALIGGPVEPSTASSAPVSVATVEEAAETAGFDVLEPAWKPVGLELGDVQVSGEEAARFTPSTENLELVMDALGIDDLTVPDGLDGEEVSVRIPSIVQLSYSGTDGAQAEFLQALSPEVAMPAGLDLPALAEIALRIAGLDREEAYDLAWTIDWRSTLIVPVPAGEATFEKIDIGGHEGVAVLPNDGRMRVLLWADGERVFALSGSLAQAQLLEMAQTAQ
jgi:hypothetical protein